MGDEYCQLTQVVAGEVERVNRIIQQFLELARPPALAKVCVELASVLARAAETVEPPIRAAGLRLERDFAGVGEAQVDADQLHQALLNLLVNAVEATDEGHIRLAARSRPEGLGGDRSGRYGLGHSG